MNDHIRRLSVEEFKDFLTGQTRYFYQQTPEFASVNEVMGVKTELIGLEMNGEIRAVAKMLYYRLKRFFYSAEIHFGPLYNHDEPEILDAFLDSLLVYLKKQRRVVRLRIAPLLQRNRYSDFELVGESDLGAQAEYLFLDKGFKLLAEDLFQNPYLQARNYYIKDIADLTFEQVLASVRPSVRYSMKQARSYDVRVRFLKENELGIYDELMAATVARTKMSPDTLVRYHRQALRLYPDTYFPVAFLDCTAALTQISKAVVSAELEVKKLREQLEQKPEQKRLQNRLQEAEIVLQAQKKRQERIQDLQTKHGDIIYLAASAFYASPSDMIYLQSAAAEDGMELCGVYAIHEQMLKIAVEKGCRYYNFFAVSGKLVEDAPDYGVMEFKRAFKGNVEELLGTYEYQLCPWLCT